MPAQSEIETLESVLLKAASQTDHHETATALLDLLWHVAEQRGDMPDLPPLLAEHEAPLVSAIVFQNRPELSRLIRAIVSAAVLPHVTPAEAKELETGLAHLESLSQKMPLRPMLTRAVSLWRAIMFANPKIGRVTADLSWNRLNVGAHTTISFQRTLRVPEDGREYPLPANLGTLSIYRIEDYADKVPPHWLEDGGFFIPLYQREALFIAFKGASWRPTAAKVAVGRINAVTGKPYDEQIRPHEQDYVIIPDQKWLDGINTGKNLVSQFVAMPIGQGYTIEEQLTDEARHGGFQIVVFEPKPDRFPIEDPALAEQRKAKALRRRIQARQALFISRLDENLRPIAECFQSGADNHFTLPAETQILLLRHIKNLMIQALGHEATAGWEDAKILVFPTHTSKTMVLMANAPQMAMMPAPARLQEMGIARGGSIKQQILRDHYGVESWDESAKRMLNIRIVNSAVFQEITGRTPPSSPVTIEAYLENEIPWFDQYDETVESVAPAKRFSFVKSIAAIAKLRGETGQEKHPSVVITPALIKRIHTAKPGERIANYLKRAEASWRAERFNIAQREATLALQLIQRSGGHCQEKERALFLRASSNSKLHRYHEAEADATELLQQNENEPVLLAIRACSYLGLKDYDLAVLDARRAIHADASCLMAHEVMAEALLWGDSMSEAFAAADNTIRMNPASSIALFVRGEC